MRRSLVVLLVAVLLATTVGAAVRAPPLAVGPAPNAGLPTGNTTLNLHVTPSTAEVTVNGTAVPLGGDGSASLHLAPGFYAVTATATGFTAFSGNVTLGPGQAKFLTIHLPAQASGSAGSVGPSLAFLLAIAGTIAGAIAVVVLILYVRRSAAPDPEPASGTTSPAAATRADEGPP